MIYSTTYLFSLSISHLVRDYEGRSALCDASHLKNNRLVLDGSDNSSPSLALVMLRSAMYGTMLPTILRATVSATMNPWRAALE